ncbi:hypothetical protein DE146DRAFT_633404 [Phaeosphaeria sp. MPI-PUGE-AT-0046c]|nr:hypothetical protein DE146DRAFT_633404 [Phaeosphaeria sp. MPI-PUGE-AT-0046c]
MQPYNYTTNHNTEVTKNLLKDYTLQVAWLAIPVKIRPVCEIADNVTYQLINPPQPLHLVLLFVTLIRHTLRNGLFPGLWTLSQRFILKIQSPNVNARLFATENEVYGRLAHLQGRLIPHHYGIVKVWIGRKLYDAYLLEQLHGTHLTNYSHAHKELSALKHKTFKAFRELSQVGVVHGDAETRNVIPKMESLKELATQPKNLVKLCLC